MYFLEELNRRNKLLYRAGWICFACTVAAAAMWSATTTLVAGVNAWVKPMKFFVSSGIFTWSMGWFLHYLRPQKGVRAYTVMTIIVLVIELLIITWQAANGRLSHFNISTPLYGILFSIMGIAISVLCGWTGLIAWRFFAQREFSIPVAYVWGIRLGLVLFVVFSFEGGLMASRLSHTVGAPDGGSGLPVLNWSRTYGDLRIAHFFGMHALQVLPLLGFFLFKTARQVIIAALVYGSFVSVLFILALNGIPVFN